MNQLEQGKKIFRDKSNLLSNSPGVYQVFDSKKDVIYVGKAKNLPHRLLNYTSNNHQAIRTERMIASTSNIEVITTSNEAEALLLEANLIKKFKPKYNVLLKDDKSFPYIQIRKSHHWPQLTKFRGKHKTEDIYFGPFASAGSANWTIKMLQKTFQLRVCDDHTFNNRKRPCILFQIKRCSGPCTKEVEKKEYDLSVKECINFLDGKSKNIQEKFSNEMEIASKNLEFEKAAILRDRIKALTQIQTSQDIQKNNFHHADVIGFFRKENKSCVVVFFYRSKQNWGNQFFFPQHDYEETNEKILESFVAQFYENKEIPDQIIISEEPENLFLINEAFNKKSNKEIKISILKDNSLVKNAVKNAEENLKIKILSTTKNNELLKEFADKFDLDFTPSLIEVYDNSHIQGNSAVGAMIAFTEQGFQKNKYRKYNLKNATTKTNDDYGILSEVLRRRFLKFIKSTDEDLPDILLIDGGKGQYTTARKALDELGFHQLKIIAMSKGKERNKGEEKFITNKGAVDINKNDPIMFFLQRLRDEAHRFAIMTHRKKRSKSLFKSPLDEIEGIGNKRKKLLLNYFGSAKSIEGASIEDIKKVDGINESIAKKIYNFFHKDKISL